jgi:hypothetical protein
MKNSQKIGEKRLGRKRKVWEKKKISEGNRKKIIDKTMEKLGNLESDRRREIITFLTNEWFVLSDSTEKVVFIKDEISYYLVKVDIPEIKSEKLWWVYAIQSWEKGIVFQLFYSEKDWFFTKVLLRK